MRSTSFASRVCVLAVAATATLALAGCKTTGSVNPAVMLERAPQQYRACARKHLSIPDRDLSYREAQLAYARAVRYGRRQNSCLKGVIAWSDAQVSAYRKAR